MALTGRAFRATVPVTQKAIPSTTHFKFNNWSWNSGGTSQLSHGVISVDPTRSGSYLFFAVILTTSSGGQGNPPASINVQFSYTTSGTTTVAATRVATSTGRGVTYTKGLFMYMVKIPANTWQAVIIINAQAGTNYYSSYVMVHQVQGWYNSFTGMVAQVDAADFTNISSSPATGHTVSSLAHTVYANRLNLIVGLASKGYLDTETTVGVPVKASTSGTITEVMSGTWTMSGSNGYGYYFYTHLIQGGASDSTHTAAIDWPTTAVPTTMHLGATFKI